jgi:thioredoxin 1
VQQSESESAASTATEALLVVGLCAAWCGTCREFEEAFATLRAERPDRRFIWIDIEDDSALADDLDIENFPSLAVFKGNVPLFYGVTEPHLRMVARLLDALEQEGHAASVPSEVMALYQGLAKRPR